MIGHVLDENEKPIPGVSIKLGGSTITTIGATDAAGNFLVNLSIAGPQVFLIDGSTANTSTVSYPTIPVTVNIQAGVVNTLGFIPHLHSQPTAKLIPITPGQETVLTDPEIPGFKMTIPTGVQIIGWDGQPNTQVSVKAIPIDRSPLPPPPAGQTSRVVYLFYFGKVGGGLPTGNIPVDTPNDVDGLPGEKVDLYYFNEAPDGTAPNQWEKYGTGTVSPDGTRIVTDINPATGQPYGIPRFCCGGRRNSPPPPPPRPGGGPSGGAGDAGQPAGEPVDTATGFFYLTKTDLVLPGILPLGITRTYRTNLSNAGPFGLGTSWEYDRFLQPPPNGSPYALLLLSPGNRQDLFARQANGTFLNTTSPALRGAVVTVTSDLRTLRLKDGSAWTFRTSDGLLLSQTDRNGNTLTLFRDSQGRVTTLAEPRGRSLTFSYTGTNLRIDRITDPLGREVRYSYDAQGRLESVTDPAGGITRYTYDANHRLLTITDPRGITFLANEYDSAGRVGKQTQADGGVWTFAYTVTGSFISQTVVTDPRGHPTTYRFNSAGYLIQQTDALGQPTTFERQPGTNLRLVNTDPLGRTTRFEYDTNGNVTKITDSQGNVRSFTYDPIFNKVTSITDPLGDLTRFEFDASGNPTKLIDPLGNATTIAYNSFGQPVSATDPLGHTTTFDYDSVGNLTTIADPVGNRTSREYDPVSRLVTLTDPHGVPVRFRYDSLNRVAQIANALNGLTAFSYDPNGNLLTLTDPQGQITAYTYDGMDRVATRTDALGRTERYEYDLSGNLTQVTDRKGQATRFSYDAEDKRTGAAYADGSATTWTYDSAGRLVAVTDSVSGTIEYGYDALDRLIRETSPQGTITYAYDALDRRQAMQVSGVAPVFYQYDAASRLTQVAQGPVAVGLGYDAAGRRTALAYSNGTSTSYAYDAASRLLSLLHQGPSGLLEGLTYTYDAAGNRISLLGATGPGTALPEPVQAAYDAANEQIQFNSGTPNLTYDANGNLTSHTDAGGTTTYTWDARNRLVGIAGPGLSASFTYDALGRRIRKSVNAAATQYLYDGNHIAAETGNDGVIATYLRGDTMDEVFARIATDTEFFHTDALLSTLLVTDPAGGVQATYAYAPFGATTASGASPTPFQFTGRENDGTGLYFYRARYYSPRLQRFLQEDPIRFAGDDLNLYAYVGNAPVTFVDPLGLKKFGPDHTPNENTYAFGEIRSFVNEAGVTPQQIADAKASLAAACGRGNDCASQMIEPNARRGDREAWQKIVDSTGGKDRSGGGSYVCVGIPGCYINSCYKCQDGQKTKVPRNPPLPTTGTNAIGANKIYYYNDPLKGWCNKQDYKSGCKKCP